MAARPYVCVRGRRVYLRTSSSKRSLSSPGVSCGLYSGGCNPGCTLESPGGGGVHINVGDLCLAIQITS